MALSALLTVVGSDVIADPQKYTAQSPCNTPYVMTSTMIDYGDLVNGTPAYVGGPVPLGYVHVQYHEQNQWKTGRLYTAQTGAEINTLVTA